MSRKRFRWTRDNYRKAHHLSRLVARFSHLPDRPAPIVERYWELWREWNLRHGGGWCIDPLCLSVRQRLQNRRNDAAGIPF
ncbi:hypothetical protein [Rhizobacter sp. OV335]|uniref:hypothetical protein n=1 Tax=Rhizobacter sp. OV335 TaxID=1500264 RepID=UPI00091F1F69|nr:hypothetical protein [Rhizobacter sp. OV335]SHN40406.1 hypothetical protein SAMN02787076_06241 [Rhizobacter sp. OV335]